MKTSIVIPLGSGSRWNDTELRYCLRSIERHLSGVGNIFIIGERPDWLQNVTHVPAKDYGDKTYHKERNIFEKIMIACNDERVTDSFLFMNDDHFLLKDYVAGEFPYYYEGLLSDFKTVTDYKHTVRNTTEYGIDGRYYDIHCPIVYNKIKFRRWVWAPDWAVKFGYCIKTLYCGINGICGSEYPDLKINQQLPATRIHELITGRAWFSMGDKARGPEMLQVLQEFYTEKSKYEK